jgi:hypothetical protein
MILGAGKGLASPDKPGAARPSQVRELAGTGKSSVAAVEIEEGRGGRTRGGLTLPRSDGMVKCSVAATEDGEDGWQQLSL